MTAAWAAIWLVLSSRAGMPTCDRLLELVDGRVESNRPAVCECLREWPRAAEPGRVRGEPVRGESRLLLPAAATWRAAAAAAVEWAGGGVGREKLCRLDELELACWVKDA